MARRGSASRPLRRQLLVFTEGKVTEPTYLAAWRREVRDSAIVNLDERTGLDPRGLVDLAVEAKLTEARDERRGRGRAHDEYWCVFDVDEHTRIREALDLARARSISVAVSNPNFELWLLLHVRDQQAHLTKDEARRAARDELGVEKSLPSEVVRMLLANHSQAAERAAALDAMHLRNGTDGNPSTGVPRLIESILKPPT